jgi:hypothetical protein
MFLTLTTAVHNIKTSFLLSSGVQACSCPICKYYTMPQHHAYSASSSVTKKEVLILLTAVVNNIKTSFFVTDEEAE